MKEYTLRVRMDRELQEQLQKYADINDEGITSVSARKAIKMFIERNKIPF